MPQVGKPKPGSNEQKVGDFYRIAADEELANRLGKTPIQPELDRIAGVMDAKSLLQTIAHLHRVGVDAGFGAGVMNDLKDSSRTMLYLGQGGLGLPDRDYYLKTDDATVAIRKKYTDHVARLLVLVGDSETDATKAATDILALETRMAKSSRTNVELRDPASQYNKRTLAQLQTEVPGNTVGGVFFPIWANPTPAIWISPSPNFSGSSVRFCSEVPLDQWKAYLRYHLVSSAAGRLSKPFVDENFQFSAALSGAKSLLPRAKRASLVTNDALGEAVGQLYVSENFSPDAKKKALSLVLNLKAALSDRIKTMEWMSDTTKKQAQRKLDTLMIKIGYPDTWRDYGKLDVKTDSYYANVARANEFEFQRGLDKLGKPVDRTEWGMTPATVNAYYNPTMNEIVFPAAILQPPFFDAKADDASNYGAIGAIIGHEMTHGFRRYGATIRRRRELERLVDTRGRQTVRGAWYGIGETVRCL